MIVSGGAPHQSNGRHGIKEKVKVSTMCSNIKINIGS